MKQLKTLVRASIAAIALAASTAGMAQVTLRLAHYAEAGHPANLAATQFAQKVEARTAGKVKVSVYPANALGSPPDQLQQVKLGAIDMGLPTQGALDKFNKAFAVVMLPFVFEDLAHAHRVLDGPAMDWLAPIAEKEGFVMLSNWEYGFRNLTNSKRPVTKLEDLDGIKLRVMQNEVYLDSFKLMGANAIPLPFSELFSALETKTVDGQENPYNTILSSKFYEVQKYLSVTNHVYSPWIMTVSKKWWDQLSKDEQKVLLDAAKASRDFERQDTREEAAKAVADLKAKGMAVNDVAPQEVNRMREKLTRVNAAIAANVGMELWNETQNELAKLRGGK